MRVESQRVQIRSGGAVLCDPHFYSDLTGERPDDVGVLDTVKGDGYYKVYTDGSRYFIDVDPRILKAKARPELVLLHGGINVDSGQVGVVDVTSGRADACERGVSEKLAVKISGLEVGEYHFWFEEKSTASRIHRGVIGFGKDIKLLVNGDMANELFELEQELAKLYRRKGTEREQRLQPIIDRLIELHMSGCNDRRIHTLADALKTKLPRRS